MVRAKSDLTYRNYIPGKEYTYDTVLSESFDVFVVR